MSLFNDLNLEAVPDTFAQGKYHGWVFNARIVQHKAPKTGQSVVLTYKASDREENGNFKNETIDEFKSANPGDDNVKKRFLKQRFIDLGVPESRLNSLDLKDIIGLEVYFTIKKNGQYTNVDNVELVTGNTTPMPNGSGGDATSPSLPSSSTSPDLGGL